MTSGNGRHPRARLPELLSGLSDREEACLQLRYAQRLGHRAISDALGLSVTDVSKTIAVAMHKVAQAIENNEWQCPDGTGDVAIR